MTHPPNRFASSTASSRAKLLNSPVNTSESPARQFGSPSGTGFEPGAEGPAIFAAFAAAQLEEMFIIKPEAQNLTYLNLVGPSF